MLEELGQLKEFNDLVGIRTHDLPVCSIVPQLITVRTPHFEGKPQSISVLFLTYFSPLGFMAFLYYSRAEYSSCRHRGFEVLTTVNTNPYSLPGKFAL
jgi:hypothetical protein